MTEIQNTAQDADARELQEAPQFRTVTIPESASEADAKEIAEQEGEELTREEILSRGQKSFREKIAQGKRRLFHPLIGVFWVFPMTPTEKQKVFDVYKDKQILSLVRQIVVRAKREDGTRIFKITDAADLSARWISDDIEEIADMVQEDLKDQNAKSIAAAVDGEEDEGADSPN